jgi:hypothetical protein
VFDSILAVGGSIGLWTELLRRRGVIVAIVSDLERSAAKSGSER